MPSTSTAFLPAVLLFLVNSLSATTYYVDFTDGSDANNGLTPATAWKNITKIANSSPSPGDVFLLQRGEQWVVGQWYISFSGTSGAPITLGAYGDPVDELPIVTNVGAITLADMAINWTESSPNIWTFSMAATPGRLFLDGTEYLRASTLAGVGINDSEGSFGHWFYDADNDLLYLYATQNPATLYSDIQGSAQFYATLVGQADYLVFESLDLRGGTGAALGILGGNYVEIRNCKLGHSGNSGILLRDAVIEGISTPTTHVTIENNIFDSNFTFFYGLGSERGCGDGLRLARAATDCVAANNTFLNWAHNAIELFGSDASVVGVNNNQFHNNHISAPDIPYAHPLGADGLLGKCQNNEFYRNYIENCRTACQINGNDNWVHHNIIVGMRRSPSKADVTAHAFILAIYQPNLVSENNRFDHNLIIDTDESAFLVRGYGLAGQVENNLIRNNIIYETGLAPYNSAYQIGTGLVIYDIADGVGGNTYQNNLFYNSTNTEPVFLQDAPGTYLTTTAFNALNGTDGNTISDNLTGDPLFTDLANENYLPQDNSPAVNAGIDVGLAVDYALQDRFVGTAPDIGPLETDVLLPVEWGRLWLDVVDETVALSWQTLAEVNTDFFAVERSVDGRNFAPIGRVMALGNSSKPHDYRFIDRDPPAGTIYYRLRQVDLDGAYAYSDILSVALVKEQRFTLLRPDRESLQLSGPPEWDWSATQLLLYDPMGRKCLEVNGSNRLSLRQLPRAAYLLVLRQGSHLETFRFLK